VKLNSVASWVYELPFGRGRKLMTSASPVVNTFLGNWQVDGTWNCRTGLPLTIASPLGSAAWSTCQMGGDRQTRANVVPGVSPAVDNRGPAAWFNPNAFTLQKHDSKFCLLQTLPELRPGIPFMPSKDLGYQPPAHLFPVFRVPRKVSRKKSFFIEDPPHQERAHCRKCKQSPVGAERKGCADHQ